MIPKLKAAIDQIETLQTEMPSVRLGDALALLRSLAEEIAGEAESAEELVRAMLSIPWSNGARVTARLTELVLARDASLLSRAAPEWIAVETLRQFHTKLIERCKQHDADVVRCGNERDHDARIRFEARYAEAAGIAHELLLLLPEPPPGNGGERGG